MLEPERLIAHHARARLAWLRSAGLRAQGGMVALAALLVGVAAAASTEGEVLLAGLAGLIAGALATATAEYAALAARLGLPPQDVETDEAQLVVHRRGGPRDDLVPTATGGLGDYHGAAPLQVAATSAAGFAMGGILPLAAASAFHLGAMPLGIATVALCGVAAVSLLVARASGLVPAPYALRACTWTGAGLAGAFAVGRIVGTTLV
ncbi:VIT1/CCC1 transporter family protein [Novosphingobium sp.]|uniref:VIT1/CCC1 transporter family protein n=1 Tax=Novosphingobium sp. TaxID=1874826 RepID=UPI0026092DEF|nr:VIT1/CCC1 transporter family protein [Novosphingobium sp.]